MNEIKKKLRKQDDIYRILGNTAPPNKDLEGLNFKSYYRDFLRIGFRDKGYEIQINCEINLSNKKVVIIDMIGKKNYKSFGVEFFEDEHIGGKSIEKFKSAGIKNQIYVVNKGSIESNLDVFLNSDWEEDENIYFLSSRYSQVYHGSEIEQIIQSKGMKRKESSILDFLGDPDKPHVPSLLSESERALLAQETKARMQVIEKEYLTQKTKEKTDVKIPVITKTRKQNIQDEKTPGSTPKRKKKIRDEYASVIKSKEKKISRARLLERLKRNRERARSANKKN